MKAWRPRARGRKAAAFPFSDSESGSGEAEPAHWGEDPALEALAGNLLEKEAATGRDAEGAEEAPEDELPVVIDDGDLGPRTERLLSGLWASRLQEQIEVFADVLPDGELRDLALQACIISQACFVGGGTFRLEGGRHLALLVDLHALVTVGYCLYSLAAPEPRTLVVEELAVAEARRGKGLGRRLVKWAEDAARTERCSSVSVASSSSLDRLLHPLGFQAAGGEEGGGPRRWKLPLEERAPGADAWACPLARKGAKEEGAKAQERGLPEFEALAGRMRLVCFLASHVSSRERLDRLVDTLASIARQEPYGPPEVFMSWSASTQALREGARAVLEGFRGQIPGLHALEQDAQLSQFLHHASSLRKAGTDFRADGWVLFSDDDDLWHPRRYFEFLYAASQVHADANVKSVAAFGHAQLRLNVAPRAVRPEDVDKLLLQGPLVCGLTDAEKKSMDIPEYFDVAVRNEQFKNFLLRTPRTILASKFCDRRFVLQFSVQGWGVRWFRPTCWLYYYSRADGITLAEDGSYKGGASFAVSVTDADQKAAERHERSRPLAGNHHVSRLAADEVAFLVASIRASIEEQVITLESLDKGWVKADQLRIVSAMAVQSRAGVAEEDTRLWAWGSGLAWDVAREVCKAIFVQIAE